MNSRASRLTVSGWSHASGVIRGHSRRRGEGSVDIGRATRLAARSGLVARGLVYIVMGWLAVEVVLGRDRKQVNQKGALAEIASRTGGKLLLIVLALGLAGYALWRFSQAVWGSPENGRKASSRFKSLVRGLVYAFLCFTAVEILTGSSRTGQAQEQESTTARLMRHTGGQWLVAGIGLVVLAAGLAMIAEGVRRRFIRDLHAERMRASTRRMVIALGAFGSTARGVVIGFAGALIIDAAATADPRKSTGLDGALRTLAHDPAGPWLLSLGAVGLIAFGLYSIVSAEWARI
jgi:hypothetical protein